MLFTSGADGDICIDHPKTCTQVIDFPHHNPAAPAERPDDRKEAAGRGRAGSGRHGQPDTSSPGDAALRALVKLLARQAAEEHVSQECRR